MRFIRRHLVIIAFLYVLVIPVTLNFIISNIVVTHIHAVERQQIDFVQGQVTNSCHRLNVLRAGQSRNNLAIYNFFKVTATDLRLSTSRTSTPAVRQGTRVFAKMLERDADDLSWTPLTNCNEARREGIAFRTPLPVYFSHRRPTGHDLVLGRDN